jgi:hypothetical protein
MSAVAGIFGPMTVGIVTSMFPGRLGWQLVFLYTFVQSSVAVLLWYRYQQSDIVPELNVLSDYNAVHLYEHDGK